MLNEKIKELRKLSNYSQIELAKLLNISRQSLGHYEQGITEPNVDTIKKLCLILQVTSDELLEIDKTNGNYFIDNNGKLQELNAKQMELINKAKYLDEQQFERLLGYLESMINDETLRS